MYNHNDYLISLYRDMEGIDCINFDWNLIYTKRLQTQHTFFSVLLWPMSLFFRIGYVFGEQIYLYKTKGNKKGFLASWFVTENII